MRLDYLRYFDHLAEVLNYTRAAEDLYIAQPTLSVAIKRMEKELGIKLFQRSEGSTRIELTEMGKAYHEYVALALKDLDKGLRIAREIQGEMNSSVRVGTIYAMQGRFWSEAIESFISSSPTDSSITNLLPLDSMNLRREYADEITMCSLVTSSKDKMALFCYSFLVSAFQDVVCLRINDLPADFHKVYLTSRRETHPKVVDDFIEFMSAYRFPNIMSQQ